MIVELDRSSSSDKPDKLAYRESRYVTVRSTCKTLDEVRKHVHASVWFFREGTKNHREEGGHTAMEREDEVWLADIPSLDWAVHHWGRIVVEPSDITDVDFKVEIYGGYRE